MASKITLAYVLLVMFLALGASSLVSSEEGIAFYQIFDQSKAWRLCVSTIRLKVIFIFVSKMTFPHTIK